MRALARAAALLAAGVACAAPAAAAPLPPQMHTFAGGGTCPGVQTAGGPCDGVAATSVPIGHPRAVAALPGGGFLYVDSVNDLVREVSPTGVVTTVAGDGTSTDAPDGTPAVDSGLDGPVAVAALPGGGFLITEYQGAVVRMVSPGGPGTATIATIAGTGTPGRNGDAGAATSIELSYPADAEPTPDGRVLIADSGNGLIRLLSAPSPAATLTTIAGGGACDDASAACAGAAATDVQLDDPVSVAPLGDGYLVAEYAASAIRRISQLAPAGTFSTVAGTPGDAGFGGDGGLATAAALDHPRQVVATADGGFLIADSDNERVRRVAPDGTIATAAGTGVASDGGDGGAATAAALQNPAAVAPTADGGFLIADEDNNAVRAVTIPPVTTIALGPPAPNGRGGWYVTSVQITATATHAKATRCIVDPVAAPPVLDVLPSAACPYAGAGAQLAVDGSHVVYAATSDAAGDKELPVSVSLKIDATPPALHCAAKPSFPFGAKGQLLSATVTDATSGPAAPRVTAPAATTRAGRRTAALTGADLAGNATTIRCAYTVLPAVMRPTPAIAWKIAPAPAAGDVRRLVVRHVPAQAAVGVACRGSGCPFKALHGLRGLACHRGRCRAVRRRRRAGAYLLDLSPLFAHRSLAAGARLTVSVTAPNATGRVLLLTLRAGRGPAHRLTCLAPYSTVPGRGCRLT